MNVLHKYIRENYCLTVSPQGVVLFGNHNGVYAEKTSCLFRLGLRNRNGNLIVVSSNEFDTAFFDCVDAEGFVIKYEYHILCNLECKVVCNCPFEGFNTYWRFDVTVVASDFDLEWIEGPCINFNRCLKDEGGEGEIFWPINEGCILSNFERRQKELPYKLISYPTPGVWGFYPGDCQMQYMAYLRENGGIYYASHDPGHRPKGIEIRPVDDEQISFSMPIFCGGETVNGKYEMPFDVVLGVLPDGDWRTAAEVYRRWVESSDTSLPDKLVHNQGLPEWYAKSPVIMIYPVRGDGDDKGAMEPNEYYPYINGLDTVLNYSKLLNSKMMSLLMHWEGTAPWAPPYVWPPFGGEEELAQYVSMLHDNGHLLGLYCSGTGWTQTSSIVNYSCEEFFDEEDLASQMCVGPKGEMYSVICNGPKDHGQRMGYDMCTDQPWVKNTILNEINKIANIGLDYIQFFDQNMGGGPSLCYSKTHNHPEVPGKWHTDGMIDLIDFVKKQIDDNQHTLLIGCEAASAQPFISGMLFNDLRYNLNWRWGKSVPAYGYVFHEYVNNFMGNQVCTSGWIDHDKCPENTLFRTAYAFWAGDMLSIVLKDNGLIHWDWVNKWGNSHPNQEDLLVLIRNLNRWRQEDPKFLCYGKAMRPTDILFPFTYQLQCKDGISVGYPSVLNCKWQAKDGTVSEYFINYLPQDQKITFQDKDIKSILSLVTNHIDTQISPEGHLVIPPLDAVRIDWK